MIVGVSAPPEIASILATAAFVPIAVDARMAAEWTFVWTRALVALAATLTLVALLDWPAIFLVVDRAYDAVVGTVFGAPAGGPFQGLVPVAMLFVALTWFGRSHRVALLATPVAGGILLGLHAALGAPILVFGGTFVAVAAWAWLLGGLAPARVSWTAGPAVALAPLAVFAFTGSFDGTERLPKGKVFVFRASHRVTFEAPSADWEPSIDVGFGAWRRWIEASGSTVRVSSGPLDASSLQEADALILVNHVETWSDEELDCVHDFVERGGCLAVLADHTDVGGQMAPTNRLLERYGVRLRFDSAIPHDDDWNWGGCARALSHPLRSFRDPVVEWGWRVGCSLGIAPPALPVLVGVHAFADIGDYGRKQDAFLGDLVQNDDEERGGVVLLAEARSGAGRVLVCGDTSSFQDSILGRTHPFIARFSRYLVEDSAIGRSAWAVVGSALAVCVLMLFPRIFERWGSAVLAAVFVGLATATTVGAHSRPVMPVHPAVVWIDGDHGNDFQSPGRGDEAIYGLELGFLRRGHLALQHVGPLEPILSHDPAAFVIVGPRADFNARELAVLDNYLERGGDVWVFAGWSEFQAAPALFEHFEIEVENLPLGRASASTPDGVSVDVRDAWPVRVAGGRTLVEAWGHALVSERRIGRGRLVVAGDTELFTGYGLEYQRIVNERNRLFFESLVGTLRGALL